jgi:hypothetical protein
LSEWSMEAVLKTVELIAPGVRIPHYPNLLLQTIIGLERCPRGRRGLPAKQLYHFGTEGSNPSFSEFKHE